MWIEVTDVNEQTLQLNMNQVISVRYRLMSDQSVISTATGKITIKGWLRRLSTGMWRVDFRDK